jgi:hypothetical protein
MALENGKEIHEVKDTNGANLVEDKESNGPEKGNVVNGTPEDPDDRLSAEERALIVSGTLYIVWAGLMQ